MFHLYVEAGDLGLVVHVGPQSSATISNRALRFPQDRGEGDYLGQEPMVRDA